MTKVLFVCLGNICRSPMGEAIFRDIVKGRGLSGQINVDSCGTEGYHIGEPPHAETRKILKEKGISYEKIKASKLNAKYLDEFDYIIAMDEDNLADILKLKKTGSKACVRLLSDFADGNWISVPDPWYTGNFDLTFELITDGCKGLMEEIAGEMDVD